MCITKLKYGTQNFQCKQTKKYNKHTSDGENVSSSVLCHVGLEGCRAQLVARVGPPLVQRLVTARLTLYRSSPQTTVLSTDRLCDKPQSIITY